MADAVGLEGVGSLARKHITPLKVFLNANKNPSLADEGRL